MSKFNVRFASSVGDDAKFINEAFDSTIPWLKERGAGGMWGDEPFTSKEGFTDETIESIRKSEEPGDPSKVLIAEHVEGDSITRVGMATITTTLPKYLTDRDNLREELTRTGPSFVFVEVIISDFNTGDKHKGAGVALVDAIRDYAKQKNKTVVYLDAWMGNDGKLGKSVTSTDDFNYIAALANNVCRYYENIGFKDSGKFSFPRKSGALWEATLFRLDLD